MLDPGSTQGWVLMGMGTQGRVPRGTWRLITWRGTLYLGLGIQG